MPPRASSRSFDVSTFAWLLKHRTLLHHHHSIDVIVQLFHDLHGSAAILCRQLKKFLPAYYEEVVTDCANECGFGMRRRT